MENTSENNNQQKVIFIFKETTYFLTLIVCIIYCTMNYFQVDPKYFVIPGVLSIANIFMVSDVFYLAFKQNQAKQHWRFLLVEYLFNICFLFVSLSFYYGF